MAFDDAFGKLMRVVDLELGKASAASDKARYSDLVNAHYELDQWKIAHSGLFTAAKQT